MVRKLTALIEKEIKDLLRDPRIYIGLIVPLLIFPLMNSIATATIAPALEKAQHLNIALLDEDKTQTSFSVRQFLENYGFSIFEIREDEKQKALNSTKFDALIEIPSGFGRSMESFHRTELKVYFLVSKLDIAESAKLSSVERALSDLNEYFSTNVIMQLGDVDPNFVKSPIQLQEGTVVKGNVIDVPPSTLISQIFGQSFFIPLIIFLLSIVVAQIAATSTAVENEEKTLETLLTLPVDRASILMAKLLASTIIAIIGTVFYMIGFQYYMMGFMGGMFAESSISLGTSNPFVYLMLGASLLIAILFTTSLGVVIGALSNDVRIANSFLGVLIIPVMIPAFVLMFGGSIESLPLALRAALLALPTSYPMMLSKSIMLGDIPIEAIYGLPYSIVATLAIIYLTSRLLEPERLFRLQYKVMSWRMKKARKHV